MTKIKYTTGCNLALEDFLYHALLWYLKLSTPTSATTFLPHNAKIAHFMLCSRNMDIRFR